MQVCGDTRESPAAPWRAPPLDALAAALVSSLTRPAAGGAGAREREAAREAGVEGESEGEGAGESEQGEDELEAVEWISRLARRDASGQHAPNDDWEGG